MKILALLIALLAASGCCQSTWFRSCGPPGGGRPRTARPAPPAPVPPRPAADAPFRPAIPSTGRLAVSIQADVAYVLRFEHGEMIVLLNGLPAGGQYRVEARRIVAGKEVTVGRSGDVCRCGAGPGAPLEVSVWPVPGRVLKAADFPVLVAGDEP